MEATQARIKLWIDAIAKEKLHGIADELEETFDSQVTEKENKGLFKMLLHLSHTANKCDKSMSTTGFEIWRIGCCICSNLTDILDSNKFFSSIYHITSCLLDMHLYKEALEICDYIRPEKLLKDASFNCEDMYSKVAYLLHNATSMLLKQSKLTRRKHFELLLIMIKYELDITQLAYRQSCWRYVLSKILSYCQKVGGIENKSGPYSYEEFTTAMLTYISQQKISLDEHNKENTYQLILSIITEMMVRNMKEKRIGSDDQPALIRYFDAFRSCLQKHRSYLRCFNLYERLSTALVRPINRVPQHIIPEIEACTCELRKIIMSYGYGDAIRWYSYSAVLLLTDLLIYWNKSPKNAVIELSSYTFILSTMIFLEEQCSIFDCYAINTCPCSDPKKCNIQYDVYNNVALRLKALSVVSRFLNVDSSNSKSRTNANNNNNNNNVNSNDIIIDDDGTIDTTDICNLAVAFSQESEARIVAIKESGCKQWSLLWPVCGAHMYNLGVFCESKYHEKSVELYSLLCVTFVKLEGINGVNGNTLLNLPYPLLSLLHRLTSVHLNNGKYEEATIVCALNGILSTKIINNDKEATECKAYKSWALIKKKYPSARELTMLQCLRFNKEEIDKIIEIHLEEYDLNKVCLREIKALADVSRVDLSSSIIAVLNEMERLGAPTESYVQGVQCLGHHLLHFKCSARIDRYLRQATIKYQAEPLPSTSLTCSYGHIHFYELRQLLRDIGEKTEHEIECAKSANTRSTSPRNGESVPSAHDLQNIVPTYSTINLTVTTKIESSMEQSLRIWKEAFALNDNYKDALEHWEIVQVLDITKIIGEYARLYHLESVEVEAWKFAYKLARELDDHRSIIYITTRSLSSRYIDHSWIEEADKSVEIVEKSNDSEIKATVLGYRLSLADLYSQNGNSKAAKELFLATTSERNESFMSDWPNFFLTANLEMNSLEDENEDQLKYTRIIVQSLYTILSIDDALEAPILSCKLKQLYHYDILFEFTNNMSHRMNGLLSWREITAHLMRRLGTAHKLGAALRVAECLKCLCYIDLSRAKSDDCEVKLQGLEHILEIEGFGLTMKSQLVVPNPSDRTIPLSSSCVVEAVRDVGQNNTSPVLRVKRFASPDFVLHNKVCMCFKCTNSRYQSLVFAATHLRAQLFSLRRNSGAALQHFQGASKIKRNIMSRSSLTIRPAKSRLNNNSNLLAISRSYRHLETVEYVFFHLDYCRFLKWSMPKCVKQGFEIALEALALCQKYNLKNHPVYASTKQLILDYRFEIAYTNAHFSKFTVPSMDEMDTGRDIHEPTPRIICVTPSRDIITQKAVSVRRKKTPPFLNLEKVPIDLTEEEPSISPSTPPRPRRTRHVRKIADTQQDSNMLEVPSERKKLIVPKISFTISIDNDENPAKIVYPAGTWKTDKRPVEGIQSKLITKNNQTENRGKASTSSSSSSSRSRKVSQRESASSRSNNSVASTSTAAQMPDVPDVIEHVAELLSDLTVTKTRSCLPLTAEKLVTMPSDDASSSGHEVAVVNRRTSSRLRKKSQEISYIDNRITSQGLEQCASESEDEVLIIGSRTRRLVTTTTDKTTTAKESVKSSRSGRMTKRTT